jgi:hypothetical protein
MKAESEAEKALFWPVPFVLSDSSFIVPPSALPELLPLSAF